MNAESILICIDPERDSEALLQKGARIALATDRPVTLLSVVYDTYVSARHLLDPDKLETVQTHLMESELHRIEQYAEGLRKRGIHTHTLAVWDTPAPEAIIRQAAELDASMVVAGVHEEPESRRFRLRQSDWVLIRDCPRPLLVVGQRPFGEPLRIAGAVDPLHEHDKPAELDDRIIQIGQTLADATEGDFHLFHVVPRASRLEALMTGELMPFSSLAAELDEQLKSRHEFRMDQLAEESDVSPERVHVRRGYITETLCQLAEEQSIDIMVVGAVARNAIARAIIGNTADTLLGTLPCDLLIVKPGWFNSPVARKPDVPALTGEELADRLDRGGGDASAT
jgi:universal stress protein E